jgi:hypothetical protein
MPKQREAMLHASRFAVRVVTGSACLSLAPSGPVLSDLLALIVASGRGMWKDISRTTRGYQLPPWEGRQHAMKEVGLVDELAQDGRW